MHYGAVSFREKIKASIDNFPKNVIILFAINFIKYEQKSFGITFIQVLFYIHSTNGKTRKLTFFTVVFAGQVLQLEINISLTLTHTKNHETLSLWEIVIRRQMFGDRN